jgi:uncharacterized membrane protein YdjX (TVP38/TMEM64 family)
MAAGSLIVSKDQPMPAPSVSVEDIPPASPLKRWAPLAVLAALIVLAYAFGLHRYFSLGAIAENLKTFVAGNLFGALLAYAGVYIAVVALSLPGAALLTILGGFLFGWKIGGAVTVIAATIGAVIVFQVVKTSLGAIAAQKAGPFVTKLSDGFAKDAFNYLLFLRLVPAFPFFAVNAVAGLSRIKLQTFALATFIGIIPGTLAFSYLGTGLDSVIDAQQESYRACMAAHVQETCMLEFNAGALLTREIIIAFIVLGLVALIPVLLKRWKARGGA